MIPVLPREQFYEQLAINIKGQALLQRYHAVAHLEAADDERFWKPFFDHYAPNRRILYLSHSSNEKGIETSGVDHAFLLRQHLDNTLFICIDSDYRYLMDEPDIDIQNFIFQTYTYSFENHHCYINGINEVCKRAVGFENNFFSFEHFLKEYSHAIYDLFIWHLYFVKYDEHAFSKLEFRRYITLYPLRFRFDNEHNAFVDMHEFKFKIGERIHYINQHYPYVNLSYLKDYYRKRGIRPDNVYLYIRGHNIFDLLCALGNKVVDEIILRQKKNNKHNKAMLEKIENQRKSFEFELKKNIFFEQYPEITKIGEDIRTFFNEK